jgi:hypothetical protein
LRLAGNGVVIVEQDRRQAASHVPFQIVGEHAEQHVRAHPRRGPVEYRAQFEVDRLHRAEGTLDAGQALVGPHGRGGIALSWRQVGAQHVDAIQCRLGGDRFVVARETEALVGDRDVEVLGDLAPAEHHAERTADLGRAAQRLPGPLHTRLDARQLLLGRRQQLVTLAGAFLGKQRIAAHHQALVGKLRIADLGHVAIVEQR